MGTLKSDYISGKRRALTRTGQNFNYNTLRFGFNSTINHTIPWGKL